MNPHQQTLHTIRNILATGGAIGENQNANSSSIYSNGGANGAVGHYGNGVVSPPHINGRPESPISEDELGLQIQRATSAPPVLDNILFATQSRYSHLFGDIRCEPTYESFYKAHQNPSKLPQPLDNDTFFMNNWNPIIEPPTQSGNPMNAHAMGHHHSSSMMTQQEQQQALLAKMNGLTVSPSRHMVEPQSNNSGWGNNFGNNNLLDFNSQMTQQFLIQQQQQAYNANIQPIQPPQKSSSPFYGQSSASVSSMHQQQQQQQPVTTIAPQIIRPEALSYSSALQKAPLPSTVNNTNNNITIVHDESEVDADEDSDDDNDSDDNDTNSPPVKEKEGKRINVAKFNTVRDALGKIYRLAKDQYGCRFLQKKLEEEDRDDIQMIFDEVYEHVVELMTDPFGNYLCQKLVEHCNESQKMAIIRAVSNDIVSISMNMHGTRAVQKLIECLSSPQQIAAITEALRHHVVTLIKDLNGNHVIQRCLQKLTSSDKQFIYNTVAGRCVEVATHKHGCCVLQRCVDFASTDQKMMLVREVASNALYLVQNPFGNYVVQYVLDLNETIINDMVISKFLGHISTLSTNKFSSNVMEKCLRIGSPFIKNAMVNEILVLENLPQVLQDSYGNYVIQTALTICDQKQFQQFNEVIRPLLHLVKNTPYGKKIESKLNKRPSTGNSGGNSSSGHTGSSAITGSNSSSSSSSGQNGAMSNGANNNARGRSRNNQNRR